MISKTPKTTNLETGLLIFRPIPLETSKKKWCSFEGGGAPELRPGFDGPHALVTASADTLRVVLAPTAFFASEAIVEVRVVATTVGGAHALDQTYQFTVEDRTAPRLVAGQATSSRTLRLGFDEPVVVEDPQGFALLALDAPAVPVTVIDATADGSTIHLTLDTELTPDARYRVTATGVADLAGNLVLAPFHQATVAGFRPARPESRRFDLWSMLPKFNRREDVTGDLARLVACLQEATDLLLAEVDRFPEIFDLERAPEVFVDLILADLGNPFPFELDALGKRRLASVLVEMYRQKGTARGIINAVRFFLGVEIGTQWLELTNWNVSNGIKWTVASTMPTLDMAMVHGHPTEPTGQRTVNVAHIVRIEHTN